MRNQSLLIFLLITCCFQVSAQSKSDSLLKIISDPLSSPKEKVESLIELSWDLMYVDTDSAYYFAERSKQLAVEHQLSTKVPDAYNVLGVVKIVQSEYSEAIIILKKGLEALELAFAQKHDEARKWKLMQREIGLLANIGNCYYHSSQYQKAIEYYMQALRKCDAIGEQKKKSTILSSIGSSYMELEKFDLALTYQKEALDVAHLFQDSISMAGSCSNIGSVYLMMNDYYNSKVYTLKAVSIYQNLGYEYFLRVAFLNLANDYMKENNNDSAHYFLERSHALLQKYPDQESEIFYNYLSGEYDKTNLAFDKAIEHYTKAYWLSSQFDNNKYKLHSSIELEMLYSNKMKFDSAYYFLAISKQLSDSLFNEKSDKRIAEMEIQYQVEKKEMEISNLEKQNNYEKQLRLLLIVLLIVILISSGITIISYVLRRKKTKQLHETEKKLMKIELDKNKIQQQKLTEDVEHKTKQLTTHAINMMQKNKLLQEINSSIAEIVKNPDADLEENFRKLKRQVNKSIKVDDDWEVFKMYFEQINTTFFDKLKQMNPGLSKYDFRLCALIKLNLNIKETAAVLNLSPNSIKSARYKLRKRLNLKAEDDLYEFMGKIG
jgi:tetratricopeptide (TPR) repeat protein